MIGARENLDDYRRRAGGRVQTRPAPTPASRLHRPPRNQRARYGYIDAAAAWAALPPNALSGWHAQRLSVVRTFARHLHVIDPALRLSERALETS